MLASVARVVLIVGALTTGLHAMVRPPDAAFAQRGPGRCHRDSECIVAASECCEPCGVFGPPAARAMSWPQYRRFRVSCRTAICRACDSRPDPRLNAVCRAGVCTLDTP